MNADQEASVLSATKKLKITDVVLASCRFERPSSNVPAPGRDVRQEHKRGVEYSMGEIETDGATEKMLQVLVQLGTRIVGDVAEGESAEVYLQIEAEYVVFYQVIGDIEEGAVSSFANFNAVHNVWPFWRQHVFDIVQRGRLPQIEVPLFAGIKS